MDSTEQMSGEIFVRIFEREFKKTLTRVDALKEWDALDAAKKENVLNLSLRVDPPLCPNAVLDRCEWDHDDYTLRVENLPAAPPQLGQKSLFDDGAAS